MKNLQVFRHCPRFTIFEIAMETGRVFGIKYTIEVQIFREIEASVVELFYHAEYWTKAVFFKDKMLLSLKFSILHP